MFICQAQNESDALEWFEDADAVLVHIKVREEDMGDYTEDTARYNSSGVMIDAPDDQLSEIPVARIVFADLLQVQVDGARDAQ
jgi:hypothetical protein